MPTFLARFTRDVTLAAGVAQDVDLPIDGAHDWAAVVGAVATLVNVDVAGWRE
jgi:hypothetical protein